MVLRSSHAMCMSSPFAMQLTMVERHDRGGGLRCFARHATAGWRAVPMNVRLRETDPGSASGAASWVWRTKKIRRIQSAGMNGSQGDVALPTGIASARLM